jgi:NAD(P)-dependent dehydrogenase (short-subunit alcohol dehydrogenase family)
MTRAFATAGASTIALISRSQGNQATVKKEIEAKHPSTKVLTFAASVTDYERIGQIIKEIGTIDVLVVNGASMHKITPTMSLDVKDVTKDFNVNVFASFNLIQKVLALPPRDPNVDRTVIYTSSAGSYSQIPGTAGYNASKAAMNYLISAFAQEKGVRAFAFHPAIAFTDLAKSAGFEENNFEYDNRKSGLHPFGSLMLMNYSEPPWCFGGVAG